MFHLFVFCVRVSEKEREIFEEWELRDGGAKFGSFIMAYPKNLPQIFVWN